MRGLIRYLVRTFKPMTRDTGADRSLARIAELVEADYVPAVIVEMQPDQDSRNLDWLGLFRDGPGHSRWSTGSQEADFEDEKELASGSRDVLVGPPGSGKTQVLARAAQFVSSARHVALIRLRSAPSGPADEATTLARWAATEEMTIDAEALASETFHFFLDGLDEVPPAEQESMVDRISAIAKHYPQHYFTVSSRGIPAVSRFAEDDWSLFEIAQGSIWQSRYLKSRGVELADLLAGQEGQDVLRSLLELPFFLVRAVEFHEEGRLAGLTAWGLVQQLVTDALAREGLKLPVSEEQSRDWMRRVALSMHLSGVISLTAEELSQISVSEAKEDNAEIIVSLVHRSMIREQGDEYTFTHRIIGESLAAEALSALEPSEDLLNAIAPVLDTGESGVRSDWRVPLSLLLPESEPWRQAIRERDPLQWARSVPASASEDERREAAQTLWNTYVEWRIWIWNRERSGFLQDGQALSRLLQSPGLDDVVALIREGIDDPSPRVQANAMEVLAGAGVELEDDLRRVLEDEGREAVVRRHAAIAARDLGLVSLLDLIVERALESADDSEAQDCSLAAVSLTPEDRRAEVFARLVTDSEGHSVVMSRIDELLGPKDGIAVLRAYAEVVDDPYGTEKNLLSDAVDALQDDDEQAVENAVFAAAAWEVPTENVLSLVKRFPGPALRALKDVTDETRGGWWWRGAAFVAPFSADELAEAGLNPDLVERRRQIEEREASGQTIPMPPAREPKEEGEEPTEPPTLKQMLGYPRDEENDYIIQRAANEFSDQVDDLTDEERDDLAGRLGDWWPDEGCFSDAAAYERSGDSSRHWTIKNWAFAWLWYGPKLDLTLSPEQWADIALSGIAYDTQVDWLRRQANEDAVEALAGKADNVPVEDWATAVRCIASGIPAAGVARIVEVLLNESESTYSTGKLVERLADQGEVKALRTLISDGTHAAQAGPQLARLGDDEAIESQFQLLTALLEKGERPDREHLFWLSGLSDDRWLAQLFAALKLAYAFDAEDDEEDGEEVAPPSPTKGRRRRRLMGYSARLIETHNVLIETIQRIGGLGALDGYNELLATDDPSLLFLRLSRDRIADTVLFDRGMDERGIVAAELGLPVFDPGSESS